MSLADQMVPGWGSGQQDQCSNCRYFAQPTADNTHGWCRMAHMKMNIRDATNKPMRPIDWCRHHAREGH